ncbi:MAG: hypothetical protein ACKO85_12830, partial [Isosphaeraceae bacterium]
MRLGIVGSRLVLAVAMFGQMSLLVLGQSPNPHATEPAAKAAEPKPVTGVKAPVANYVSAAELRMKQDVSYLAADAREGRGPGTAGIDDAANYIADEFKRIGLKPAPNAHGYFQKFSISNEPELEAGSKLAVALPGGKLLNLSE